MYFGKKKNNVRKGKFSPFEIISALALSKLIRIKFLLKGYTGMGHSDAFNNLVPCFHNLRKRPLENNVGNGEKADCWHFLLSHNIFFPIKELKPTLYHFLTILSEPFSFKAV